MLETVATQVEMAATLSRMLQRESDRVHALHILTWTAHFNFYRMIYNQLSFEDKQRLYQMYLEVFPQEDEVFDTEFVLQCLQQIPQKNLRIAELGGYQGELAQHIIKELHIPWVSFEIIPHKIPKNIENLFTEYILSKELWQTNLDLSKITAFISMHTLEHFSDQEFIELVKYLVHWKVPYLIFQMPIQPEGQTWRNYYGAHVLKMGSTQVKKLLAPHYRLKAEVPKGKHVHEGWCCFYEYKTR